MYQPTVLEYTRKIINPGFHKINQNTLRLAKYINPDCGIKVVEAVSKEIFLDRDELQRLHEFNMTFEYSIDIEKPSNVSQYHLVTYYLPTTEFKGIVTNVNTTITGDWLLKWYFPFHLRYRLPNKDSSSFYEATKDMSEFYLKEPEFFVCNSEYLMKTEKINDFDELVANDITEKYKRWNKLHIMPNLTDNFKEFNDFHHALAVPMLPNFSFMNILGLLGLNSPRFTQLQFDTMISYETISASIVISSIFLIGYKSYAKSA